ncbi:MAG: alpha-hydroxy-acid oxidizing protein, partial [Thaumarchaeota archaeon]|nr:alpha-hydroxy-acid oxidizing protein [Nitrososphaerota archaeon]
TDATIFLTRNSVKTPIIASGGLRNGLDLAKTITLGADVGGFARPMLTPASKSYNSLKDFINQLILELKSTMFLVGAKNIDDLKSIEYITTEPLTSWISKVHK